MYADVHDQMLRSSTYGEGEERDSETGASLLPVSPALILAVVNPLTLSFAHNSAAGLATGCTVEITQAGLNTSDLRQNKALGESRFLWVLAYALTTRLQVRKSRILFSTSTVLLITPGVFMVLLLTS